MKRTHETLTATVEDKDPSWEKFDAFYHENIHHVGATPELFAPPKKEDKIQFLSSKEYDERIPSLCKRIRKLLERRGIDHVLLWVDDPGKSNLWMSLKCWPYLRDFVDEVWSTGSKRDPYGGGSYSNAHIFIDDAIFTGEQMSIKLIEGYRLQPCYVWNGTNDHLWVVASMAISDDAKRRIRITTKRGDADYCLDDDPYEPDPKVIREVKFVSEVRLMPSSLEDERPSYYSGFKVPDGFSIPLVRLVERNAIPGVTKENLTQGGIVRVSSPQPPYRSFNLTWEGRTVKEVSNVVG